MNDLLRSWTGFLVSISTLALLPSMAFANKPSEIAEAAAELSAEQSVKEKLSQSENDPHEIPAGLMQIPVHSGYYSPYAFVVDKSARVLSVWQQTPNGLKRIAQHPADMGKATGDKRLRGDHRTPEGVYFLQERLEGPTLNFDLYGKRAFTLDYPNHFDRLERKTGYGIWLHAIPDKVPLTRGSRGCVVVRNDVILGLTDYVRLGRTPIIIQEKVERLSAEKISEATTEINKWIEDWRAAWERKDIDSYIAKYGSEFRSMKMNREQWREYKTKLNENYKSITVRISRPAIFKDRDTAVVRFLQEYHSDQHSDYGEKVLYLKKDNEGYKIVGESWAAEKSELALQEIQATTNSKTAMCLETSKANCL